MVCQRYPSERSARLTPKTAEPIAITPANTRAASSPDWCASLTDGRRQNVGVEDQSSDEVRAALADAIRLWRLEPTSAEDVVNAAVDCLLAGVDTPSVCELAGVPRGADVFSTEPLISEVLRELGMQHVMQEDIQRGAFVAMLHMFRSGRVNARDLARWAHSHIGHDGDADCQAFVDLDDMYDTLDYANYRKADLDRWTWDEATAFLDGQPSPRHTDIWRDPGNQH